MAWTKIIKNCDCAIPEPIHPVGSVWFCDKCGCEYRVTTVANKKLMTPNRLLWRQ